MGEFLVKCLPHGPRAGSLLLVGDDETLVKKGIVYAA
jgi:hypothetical protein